MARVGKGWQPGIQASGRNLVTRANHQPLGLLPLPCSGDSVIWTGTGQIAHALEETGHSLVVMVLLALRD